MLFTPVILPANQLALRYSSNRGQGPYGRGWRLELGRVERSTRRGVPKDNDTDHFVLLLPGGAVRVELVEKVTETGTGRLRWVPQADEAFLRVVQNVEASPTAEANTWEVWDKGGTRFTFGGANARVGQDPGSASGTFGWYLTRIEDPNGNTLEITYMAVDGETPGTYVYPAQINYGANPGASFPNHKHHVVFTWEPTRRPDLVENGTGGYLSWISRRLQKIEISTDGVNAGLAFQRYEFGYIPSPNSSQSLLDNIRRSGVDLDTGNFVSLPTVSLTYRGESLAPTPFKFFDSEIAYSWPGPAVSDWPGICNRELLWCKNASTQETRRRTIDINGDGLVDYVDTTDWNSQTKQWQVHLNNGQGFNAPIPWSAPVEFIQVVGAGGAIIVDTFDIDGDGKPDHVDARDWNSQTKQWQVYQNKGDGFKDATEALDWPAPTEWIRTTNTAGEATRDVFDFNGDGRPDYVISNTWTASHQFWEVAWNNRNGFDSKVDFSVKRNPNGTEVLGDFLKRTSLCPKVSGSSCESRISQAGPLGLVRNWESGWYNLSQKSP